MNYYIIYWQDGTTTKAEAKSDLELVKKYDLANKQNIGTRFARIATA